MGKKGAEAVPSDDSMPMVFDRMLEIAGDKGVYQITLFLLISVMVFSATDSFSINFIAAKMDHWCHVDAVSNSSFDVQRRLTSPSMSTGYSQCLRYDTVELAEQNWNVSVNTTMTIDAGQRHTMKCDDGWVYDKSVFVSTIVSEVSVLTMRTALLESD